jgi:hypothetical protein
VGSSSPRGNAIEFVGLEVDRRIAGVNVLESEDLSPRSWLADPAHAALVERLELKRGEQLLVAGNVTSPLAKPQGFDYDWQRLGHLTALLRELPADEPFRTGS